MLASETTSLDVICCNKAENSEKSNIKYFDCWHPRRTPSEFYTWCLIQLTGEDENNCLGIIQRLVFEGIENQEKSLMFYTCCRPQYIIQRHVFEGIRNQEKSLLFYSSTLVTDQNNCLDMIHNILYSDLFLRESSMKKNSCCSTLVIDQNNCLDMAKRLL